MVTSSYSEPVIMKTFEPASELERSRPTRACQHRAPTTELMPRNASGILEKGEPKAAKAEGGRAATRPGSCSKGRRGMCGGGERLRSRGASCKGNHSTCKGSAGAGYIETSVAIVVTAGGVVLVPNAIVAAAGGVALVTGASGIVVEPLVAL